MPEFLSDNMQVIVAALVVLVLLIIVLMVWRALSPRVAGRRGQRLGISEYFEIDKTRRLVLIRRDDREHLLLIGGPQDVVIEQGIEIAPPAAAYAPRVAAESPPPGGGRPAPRPPVFGDRRAPALRPAETPSEPSLAPPGRDS